MDNITDSLKKVIFQLNYCIFSKTVIFKNIYILKELNDDDKYYENLKNFKNL